MIGIHSRRCVAYLDRWHDSQSAVVEYLLAEVSDVAFRIAFLVRSVCSIDRSRLIDNVHQHARVRDGFRVFGCLALRVAAVGRHSRRCVVYLDRRHVSGTESHHGVLWFLRRLILGSFSNRTLDVRDVESIGGRSDSSNICNIFNTIVLSDAQVRVDLK